jgi:nitrogen fixation protein NifZ
MIDPREPKFQWGQPVVAAVDLYNDGSLPDAPEDALLVVAGGPGEIVQVGHHSDANVPIYMVDFGVAVLGCLEEELVLSTKTATATAPAPSTATAPVAEALP